MTLATDCLRVTAIQTTGATDTGEPTTENVTVYIAKTRIIQITDSDAGGSILTVDGGGTPYIVTTTEAPGTLLIQTTAV